MISYSKFSVKMFEGIINQQCITVIVIFFLRYFCDYISKETDTAAEFSSSIV